MKVEKIEQFKGQSFPFLKPVECNKQTLNIIGNVRSSPMNNGQFMFDVVLGTKPTREEYQNFRYWYFDGVKESDPKDKQACWVERSLKDEDIESRIQTKAYTWQPSKTQWNKIIDLLGDDTEKWFGRILNVKIEESVVQPKEAKLNNIDGKLMKKIVIEGTQ